MLDPRGPCGLVLRAEVLELPPVAISENDRRAAGVAYLEAVRC